MLAWVPKQTRVRWRAARRLRKAEKLVKRALWTTDGYSGQTLRRFPRDMVGDAEYVAAEGIRRTLENAADGIANGYRGA